MNIFVDENIPLMTVKALCEMGYEVLDIRGTEFEGEPDDAIWKKVLQEKQMLITTDKGFAKNRYELHYGILVVCLRQPNRLKIHQRVMKAINQFRDEEWPGLLVVMRDKVQSVSRTNKRKSNKWEKS